MHKEKSAIHNCTDVFKMGKVHQSHSTIRYDNFHNKIYPGIGLP